MRCKRSQKDLDPFKSSTLSLMLKLSLMTRDKMSVKVLNNIIYEDRFNIF